MKQKVFTAGSLDVTDWGLDFHQLMLNDTLRMDAYKKAIFEVIRPGMSVCEIGVGTGILSRWALEAGASIVYGIEVNSKILEVAKKNLHIFGNKFIPLQGLSYDMSLPEKVDIVLSEILGNIVDNEDCVPILADARKRFLKDDGQMLPIQATSYLVPVSAEKAHEDILAKNIYSTHADSILLGKFEKMKASELFDFYFDTLIDADLYLSNPSVINTVSKNTYNEYYQKNISFTVTRSGKFTGFKGWFRAQLSPSVVLDIESADTFSPSWKHAFFPIEFPISVESGDIIELHFARSGDNQYAWSGKVERKGKKTGVFGQTLKLES